MSGRVFAGARALYRAAGVSGDDMGKKPIIAIANSFDEFLPGHVHLNKVGRIVSEAIKEAGGIPREFNTMAVDDGIAMGHTGMLYSLPPATSSPTPSNTSATRTVPTHSSASRTATRSCRAC